MAGFGGAVKLTGESEYRRALDQITQNLRELSAEMTVVSTKYDRNDTSVEALTARGAVLNNQLSQQKTKLELLNRQYSAMDAEYQKQLAAHKDLESAYNAEKAKLETIAARTGTTSAAYKAQQTVVSTLGARLKESTQSMDANEKQMSKMRVTISQTEADANKTTKAIDQLGNASEKSGKQAGESADGGFTVFKGMCANLAAGAVTSLIGSLKDLAKEFVDVGKKAIGGFGEFEQLSGGVQKIFGDDLADEVKANAQNAFKTAGVSANEYMKNVTSFSATLLAGLGEDTAKAAEYADMAMRNMADNANTFGTDLASIQNAYQGFAKDNYTMLDNLKLGYGGTASEMARLINESGVLGDEMQVTAQTVKEVPFHKMVEAIDATQKRMGIFGTTAKEADGTIQGATGSMRAAWSNLLTGMADDSADFGKLTSDFIGTLITPDGKGGVIGTIVPRISNVITGISSAIQTLLPQVIQTIVPLIQENLPILLDAVKGAISSVLSLLPEIMPVVSDLLVQVVSLLLESLPDLIDAGSQIIVALADGLSMAAPKLIGMLPSVLKKAIDALIKNFSLLFRAAKDLIVSLIQGISAALPELIGYIPVIIESIVNMLIDEAPTLLSAAMEIITALGEGLLTALPELVKMIPQITFSIVSTIISRLPDILAAGCEILWSLIKGIGSQIASLGKSVWEICKVIIDKIKELPGQMLDLGKKTIEGLGEGIKRGANFVKEKAQEVAGKVTGWFKNLFGIHSPSTLFRDEIGENLALGIGEGFTDGMKTVSQEMADAVPTSFDVAGSVSGVQGGTPGAMPFDSMVDAFKEALAQMKIELDDEVAGRFVDATVTRLIYN